MNETGTKYWLGVASLEHVAIALKAGICQFAHGKMSAVKTISPGDWIVYYSPKDKMDGGKSVQAFTAIGQVEAGDVKSVETGEDIHYQRPVNYRISAEPAAVRPLLNDLSFVKNPKNWGLAFRLSKREIEPDDFATIAKAMGVSLGSDD